MESTLQPTLQPIFTQFNITIKCSGLYVANGGYIGYLRKNAVYLMVNGVEGLFRDRIRLDISDPQFLEKLASAINLARPICGNIIEFKTTQ